MRAVEQAGGGGRVRTPLAGCGIAVTRPLHQAAELKRAIERLGGAAILFPTIAIDPVADDATLNRLQAMVDAEMVVFVSPNAVWHGVSLVRSRVPWPSTLQVAAVGRSTARALQREGVAVDFMPTNSSGAAALLELPAFAADRINQRKVVVLKGRGGLELLAEELTGRGARVQEVDVYQRCKPELDAADFLALAESGAVDAVVLTSGDALRNLFDMVGTRGRTWLMQAELIVVSDRIADLALDLGVSRRPFVADGAGSEQLSAALKHWKETIR